MTYEEKKEIIKTTGSISGQLLDPIDYFKFLRDGFVKTIKFNSTKQGEILYEVHCILLSAWPWEDIDIYSADKCNSISSFNKFMLNLINDNLIGYMELEKNCYKIELDVLETYE